MGLTMFWCGMWDDKLNFSKKLKEDIFINMFLCLIFTGSMYNSNIFYSAKCGYYNNSFFVKLSIIKAIYFNNWTFFNKQNHICLIKPIKIKNFAHYLGKLWILRFQGWLILSLTIYTPQTSQSRQNISQYEFNLQNQFSKSQQVELLQLNKIQTNAIILKNRRLFFFYNWFFYSLCKLKFFKNKQYDKFITLY